MIPKNRCACAFACCSKRPRAVSISSRRICPSLRWAASPPMATPSAGSLPSGISDLQPKAPLGAYRPIAPVCPQPAEHRPLQSREFEMRHPCEPVRSEEHTSELQSLMRISYAVFCLKKKKELNTKE